MGKLFHIQGQVLACQLICEKGVEEKEDLGVLLFLVAVKMLASYRRE